METDDVRKVCNIDSNQIEILKKFLSDIHDETELEHKSNVFEALSDPTRLKYCTYLNTTIYVYVKSWQY